MCTHSYEVAERSFSKTFRYGRFVGKSVLLTQKLFKHMEIIVSDTDDKL